MTSFHAIWGLTVLLSFIFAIVFVFIDERKEMKKIEKLLETKEQ